MCPELHYYQNYGCKYDSEEIAWFNEDGEKCNYETTYEYFCMEATTRTSADEASCPMAVTYFADFENPDQNGYDGYFYPYNYIEPYTEATAELYTFIECFYDSSAGSWYHYPETGSTSVTTNDVSRCPVRDPSTYDKCYEARDGKFYTDDG